MTPSLLCNPKSNQPLLNTLTWGEALPGSNSQAPVPLKGWAMALAVSLILTIIPAPHLRANEGMWLPNQVKVLAPEAKAISSSILSAIVKLGGCSGSLVSPHGLIVTNHHCVHGTLQYNSSEQNNYIKDGFVASSPADELRAAPGSHVYVKVKETDITKQIRAGLDQVSGYNATMLIEWRRKNLIKQCENSDHFRCEIASFYGGSQYTLIKNMVIKDLRLAYAPPLAIGAFGGDTDNWMWPRHAGDFAFYRAYVAKDGSPKAYSPDNVPYSSPSYLKAQGQGVQSDEFVMVAGFPGHTSRHRFAADVDFQFNKLYPRRLKEMSAAIALIELEGKANSELAIKYASRMASLANYRKNIEGQLASFQKSSILTSKRELESKLSAYLTKSGQKQALSHWTKLNQLILERQDFNERTWQIETLSESQLLNAANRIYRLAIESEKPDMERREGYQERDLESFKDSMARMDKRFDATMDAKLWLQAIEFVLDHNADQVPSLDGYSQLHALVALPAKTRQEQIKSMYDHSKILTADQRLALVGKTPAQLRQLGDPFLNLVASAWPATEHRDRLEKDLDGRYGVTLGHVMVAKRAYFKAMNMPLYPDANRTLRLTYGHVKSFSPDGGALYPQFTYTDGILAKEGSDPFEIPKNLKSALIANDFGPHVFAGKTPVDFITDLDITGGNSGSATLNQRGELVGLAFDGNIEGVISDWDFIPRLTRSIHVDFRYMHWLMDRVYPAPALLEEMTILNSPTQPGRAQNKSSQTKKL